MTPHTGAPSVLLIRAARAERIALAVLSAGSVLALALAFAVVPDPRGVGTHEQLGLPPCGLLQMTGVPCPSCGLTTAFAHAVRFEPLASARAQPLGLVMAALAAAFAAAGPVLAIRGTPVLSRIEAAFGRRLGFGLLGAIALSWLYKIAVTFFGSRS